MSQSKAQVNVFGKMSATKKGESRA